MRFEKLNENKIRIILNNEDLIKNNIDFHDFMANPIDSQSLFFNVLNEAEKEIGFVTKNYNIKIEALQIANGDFVLTITRSVPESSSLNDFSKRLKVKRKISNISNTAIYCFSSFDDFCLYATYLHKNNFLLTSIAKNISLYEFKNQYYLVFTNINLKYIDLNKVFSLITEFATYTSNTELFKRKLIENGNIVMKNNALKTAIEYFA